MLSLEKGQAKGGRCVVCKKALELPNPVPPVYLKSRSGVTVSRFCSGPCKDTHTAQAHMEGFSVHAMQGFGRVC